MTRQHDASAELMRVLCMVPLGLSKIAMSRYQCPSTLSATNMTETINITVAGVHHIGDEAFKLGRHGHDLVLAENWLKTDTFLVLQSPFHNRQEIHELLGNSSQVVPMVGEKLQSFASASIRLQHSTRISVESLSKQLKIYHRSGRWPSWTMGSTLKEQYETFIESAEKGLLRVWVDADNLLNLIRRPQGLGAQTPALMDAHDLRIDAMFRQRFAFWGWLKLKNVLENERAYTLYVNLHLDPICNILVAMMAKVMPLRAHLATWKARVHTSGFNTDPIILQNKIAVIGAHARAYEEQINLKREVERVDLEQYEKEMKRKLSQL